MSFLRRRSALGAAILAIGVVTLAGCGGSSSGGKSTVSPGSGGGATPASTPASNPTTSGSSSGSGGGYGY